jgi:2-polyprenyl-3-methyl-5-hydroxy-6-metoxy-1,4-benzoquinol methylase
MRREESVRQELGTPTAPEPFRANLARWRRLFAAFRREQADPESYYGVLARDTVGLVGCFADLAGATVVDVGGGPGYMAEVLRTAGAQVI